MTRRYGEPIDVRSDSLRNAPESFLWRGRVYLVRDVLDHWWERRAWWAESAARAVHGEEDVPGDAETSRVATREALDTEREIWRVEACRGRQGAPGVFELCHDYVLSAHPPGVPAQGGPASAGATPAPDGLWHLVRVGD